MPSRGSKLEASAEEQGKLRQTDFSQKVEEVEGHLYVRRKPVWDAVIAEERRYTVGVIPLATVDVYKPGFPFHRFVVKTADLSRGNGRQGFATEKALHAFLVDLLQTKPNP